MPIKPLPNAPNVSADINVALHRSRFDHQTIRVTTDGSEVKLTGFVHTPADRYMAAAAAWGLAQCHDGREEPDHRLRHLMPRMP